MQILFVHPNFPAQFGHIASRLAQRAGIECVFVTRSASGLRDGVRCIRYQIRGGATHATHYCSRTFENAVWNAHAVYEACRTTADQRPDLRRFRFLDTVPREQLAEILSVSDLHIYLTVPFVLSWSLFNALACECIVLASDTAPVREVICHEKNGLLADFFDVDGLAAEAVRVLKDPAAYTPLATAGRALIQERYSLEKTLPQLWDLFTRLVG
jgi:glycosyltransferase involved in cell wall biosynthesis